MIHVICCSSLLSVPGRAGLLAGILPQVWPWSAGLLAGLRKLKKLKAPLIPGPEGAVDSNDWCITISFIFGFMNI